MGGGRIFRKTLRGTLINDDWRSIEWAQFRPDPSRCKRGMDGQVGSEPACYGSSLGSNPDIS